LLLYQLYHVLRVENKAIVRKPVHGTAQPTSEPTGAFHDDRGCEAKASRVDLPLPRVSNLPGEAIPRGGEREIRADELDPANFRGSGTGDAPLCVSSHALFLVTPSPLDTHSPPFFYIINYINY
jgi:hypothetical protein